MEGHKVRAAEFQAVAALLLDDRVHVSRGVCRGSIAMEASGDEGFGFDPIFVPSPIERNGEHYSTNGLTFAEVSLSVKEQFSHRRNALEGLFELLSTIDSASSS